MSDRYLADASVGDSYTPDNFLTGSKQVTTITITVKGGQGIVPARSVMGFNGSDLALLSASGASDGSEVPKVITTDAIDTTAGDVTVGAYADGEFNPDALNLGTGHTVASVTAALRDAGIYLKKPV